MERERLALNYKIREASNTTLLFDDFFDFDHAFQQHSLNETTKKLLWDDGIHPTAEGYNIIGEHLSHFFYRQMVLFQ